MHAEIMYEKEAHIQQAICNLLSVYHIFYFSIPNEHYNISHAQGTTLKKMGLVPGMPDLAILHGGKIYFMEIKNAEGRLTEHQKIIHAELSRRGYVVSVVRSVADAIVYLNAHGITT